MGVLGATASTPLASHDTRFQLEAIGIWERQQRQLSKQSRGVPPRQAACTSPAGLRPRRFIVSSRITSKSSAPSTTNGSLGVGDTGGRSSATWSTSSDCRKPPGLFHGALARPPAAELMAGGVCVETGGSPPHRHDDCRPKVKAWSQLGVVAWLPAEFKFSAFRATITPLGSCPASPEGSSC